jgi:hypothetical protein
LDDKLVGMLTIERVVANAIGASINTTLLNTAYGIWQQYEPETFPGPTKVDNYALFAFAQNDQPSSDTVTFVLVLQ